MKIRDTAIGLVVGTAIASTAWTVIPRVNEVGTVAGILRDNPTLAVGPVHVTTDSTDTGVRRMATWDASIEGGVIDAILHDAEYRDTLMRGLGPAYYTRFDGNGGLEHRIVRAILPVPYKPNTLYVLLDDATWVAAHRSVWHLIKPGYLSES